MRKLLWCQMNCGQEATEQLSNETKLYVCYGCKIIQKEVTTFD